MAVLKRREQVPSIAITPTTNTTTISASGTATVDFTLTRSGGFTGVVTPVAAGLPTGVTAAFSPTTFGVGVTSLTMTLTGSSAPAVTDDAYTVTFSGSGVTSVVHNGTVTVADVTLLFNEQFTSGDWSYTSNGISWISTPGVNVSPDKPYPGNTYSASFNMGASGDWAEARFSGLPNLDEVFLEYPIYQPNGSESPSLGPATSWTGTANNKFFRLWGGDYAESNPKVGASTYGPDIGLEYNKNNLDGTMDGMGQGGAPIAPDTTYDYAPFLGVAPYLGKWTRVRIHARQAGPNDDSTNGILRIWLDDTLVLERVALRSNSAGLAPNTYTAGYLFGFANSPFPANQRVFVGYLKISTGGFVPTISIASTSASTTLTPNGSGAVTFTLTRSGGFTGVVTPVATGLPTGVTASFSPTTFGAGVTSMTMTLTGSSAPTVTDDAYTVTFSGSGVSNAVYNGTVTVQAASTFAANLPAGMTLVTDTDFAGTPQNTGLGANGLAFVWDGRVITDNTSPYTATVFETFYTGNDAGNGGGGALIYSGGGYAWKRMYFALWVKLSADYSIHTNEEKFFYPVPSGGGSGFMLDWYTRDTAFGSGGGAGATTWTVGFDAQRGDGRIYPTMAVYPTKGVWQKWEVYMVMNTGSNADGRIQLWIDGVQAFNRTDIRFTSTGGSTTFDGIRFDGTRGGGASSALTPASGQNRRYGRLAFYASTT